MNFNEFTDNIMELLKKKLGREYHICKEEVIKNNGVTLTGLSVVKEGECIAPTCYLDNLFDSYKSGDDLEKIVDCIYDKIQENIPDELTDFRFYFDYNKVSDRVVYKLINYEKNASLLKDVPHRRYLDLAIVYEYYIQTDAGIRATILIHENHLKMWGRKEEDLYLAAKENTPRILEMEKFDLFELFEIREYTDGKMKEKNGELPSMLVLTNKTKLFGAAVILYEGVLANLSQERDSDFIILPSSVHEVILLPYKEITDASIYEDMVRDVNDTELDEQEILSYHVYFYSKIKNEVTIFKNDTNTDDER